MWPDKETTTQVEFCETKMNFDNGVEENELTNECEGEQVSKKMMSTESFKKNTQMSRLKPTVITMSEDMLCFKPCKVVSTANVHLAAT